MISLLLAVRKDSKWLAHFMMNFLTKTKDFNNVELLIFLPPEDTWNTELLEYFNISLPGRLKVFSNDTGLERGGCHVFYNTLAEKAIGDWLMYVCDDWSFHEDYDEYLVNYINENSLDSNKLHVIAPCVDNSGRVAHIISRKFFDTVGFGPQGNVDSCINDTLELLEVFTGQENKVLHLPPQPVLHDFSLDGDLFKLPYFDKDVEIALFKSKPIKDKIAENARKLFDVYREKK